MKLLKIYYNGQFIPAKRSLLEELSPGIKYVAGVFESMRVYPQGIFAFDDHYRRMKKGAAVLGLVRILSKTHIRTVMTQLMKVNHLSAGRMRISVWRESGRSVTAIVCMPYKDLTSRQRVAGWKALVSSFQRNRGRTTSFKTLDYALFQNALKEARQRHCDEAILLNGNGDVVEGSRTNIFFVKDGTLFTPALRCGCLDGVTRRWVMRLARAAGYKVRRGGFSLAMLKTADEAFMTNAVAGIVPLASLDGIFFKSGSDHPMATRLAAAYSQATARYFRKVR